MKLEIVQIVNSCKSTPVQTIFFYPGHPLDHLVSLLISHLVNLSNEEEKTEEGCGAKGSLFLWNRYSVTYFKSIC